MHTGFWCVNVKEEDHLEDPGIDGRMIFKKWVEWGMDWIDLASDRDRWGPVVNAVMNFRVP